MSPLTVKRTTPGAQQSTAQPSTPAPVSANPAADPSAPPSPATPTSGAPAGQPSVSNEPLDPSGPVTSDPGTDAPDLPDHARELGMYRRRRAITALALVGLSGGALWMVNRPSATPVVSGVLSSAPTARAQIDAVLTEAAAWKQAHGTFSSFSLAVPAGVRIAAWGPAMVVSVSMNGTCLYSGIYPSGPKPVLVDSTRSACTDAAITKVRSALHAITVTH